MKTTLLQVIEGISFGQTNPSASIALSAEELFDYYQEHAPAEKVKAVTDFLDKTITPLSRYVARDYDFTDEDEIKDILRLNKQYGGKTQEELYLLLIQKTNKYIEWMIKDLLDI